MKPETETSWVELSVEDADIAVRAYDIVGYRVVGLQYEGAFAPQREADGTLVLGSIGATAIRDCLVESKQKCVAFADRIRERHLVGQRSIPPQSQLENLLAAIDRMQVHSTEYERIQTVLDEFLEQSSQENAA